VALVACAAVAADAVRPPERQLGAALMIGAVRAYRATASGWLDHQGIRCRFNPTCSWYAEQAVRRHGWARGSWLAVKRIVRCGPWVEPGTDDPVPLASPPPAP
jgi:putative membrane protein insertion efficiency factor